MATDHAPRQQYRTPHTAARTTARVAVRVAARAAGRATAAVGRPFLLAALLISLTGVAYAAGAATVASATQTAALTAAQVAAQRADQSSSVNSQPRRIVDDPDQGALIIRSCVVRWKRVGGHAEPYLYTNGPHPCPGIRRAQLNRDGDVVLYPDTASFTPVMFVSASPDETYAHMGLIAGASAGKTITLRFYLDGRPIRGDLQVLGQPTGNLWVFIVSSGRAARSGGTGSSTGSSSTGSSGQPRPAEPTATITPRPQP